MKYDLAASTQLLAVVQRPQSAAQATNALWQLLKLSNERIDNMPPRVARQLRIALTGGAYAQLFDDTDATVPFEASPLLALSRAIERVMPTVRITNAADFDTVAARLFQRFKERRAPLAWRMVHPVITAVPQRMSRELLESAFTLQQVIGQQSFAEYPVVFALDQPVACVLQGLYLDQVRGLRHLTLLAVVPRDFLRMTVLPHYMLGYDGHDGLVWMQKGFRVRVGGIALPPQAAGLSELLWQFTDYRWERRVAYHPVTGAVVEHNARVLTH